jgi:hypothetical protein
MKLPFRTHNDALFEQLDTFLVAPGEQLEAAELAPFGLPVRWHVDPMHMRHAGFFALLQRLDALTFGTVGMPMEKWVFYDCSELPGFIYGFALEASRLQPEERALFAVPDGYVGPVPLSMYIAIPMREPGAWFGHNLASLNRQLPARGLAQLGTITKAMALKAMKAERNVGVTQWTSPALHVHTRFGPLTLETAWTPVHSFPASLTYAFDIDEQVLRAALGDPEARLARPAPTRWVDVADHGALQALQAELEDGLAIAIAAAPRDEPSADGGAGRRRVPLAPRG